MLLKDFVVAARARLSEVYSQEEAAALVGMLCTEYLGVQSYTYIVNPGCEIKEKLVDHANAALERMLKEEPFQYILGYAEFCGQKFNVSSGVLIPRPETEGLCKMAIEAAMKIYRSRSAYGDKAKPVRILDLCTGSGCIAWTMYVNVPNVSVTAVDISEEALKIAQNQPIEKDKAKSVQFIKADIFEDEEIQSLEPFDIVISNPPYVRESEKAVMKANVLEYEPHIALFVPDDDSLRFYKKIADIGVKLMAPGSEAFLEINEALDDATAMVFTNAGYKDVEIVKDIFGKARYLKFKK